MKHPYFALTAMALLSIPFSGAFATETTIEYTCTSTDAATPPVVKACDDEYSGKGTFSIDSQNQKEMSIKPYCAKNEGDVAPTYPVTQEATFKVTSGPGIGGMAIQTSGKKTDAYDPVYSNGEDLTAGFVQKWTISGGCDEVKMTVSWMAE